MANYEIYHHGVLKQQWGVRKYQNPDGSLTEAGKERYRRKTERRQKLSSAFEPTIKSGKDKAPISPAEKVAKESTKAIDNATNLVNSISSITNGNKGKSVSEMSNQELQEYITRMQLEDKYADLSASRVSRGASYAKEILSITGSVVGIASAGIGIATAIKGLKG